MRRVAFYTVAVTIGFLLAVIAGEFAVRLASAKWRNVRYLATIDDNNKGLVHKNLAQFLDSKPQVSPFAVDMNYQNNSLGFKDTEFVKPKTPGGFRIMAVGDSFTHGVVPYPASVMTILEIV